MYSVPVFVQGDLLNFMILYFTKLNSERSKPYDSTAPTSSINPPDMYLKGKVLVPRNTNDWDG